MLYCQKLIDSSVLMYSTLSPQGENIFIALLCRLIDLTALRALIIPLPELNSAANHAAIGAIVLHYE